MLTSIGSLSVTEDYSNQLILEVVLDIFYHGNQNAKRTVIRSDARGSSNAYAHVSLSLYDNGFNDDDDQFNSDINSHNNEESDGLDYLFSASGHLDVLVNVIFIIVMIAFII